MKKVFILLALLVLGIASMASAALTLSGPTQVVAGQTVTITLSADAESAANGDYGYLYVGPDSFSNIIMLPPMEGIMSSIDTFTYNYTYFYFAAADSPSDPLSAGDWLTFDVTADVTTIGGTIVISVVSFAGFDGDTHNIDVIPEPMTIGLLGLGGLFLRRRK